MKQFKPVIICAVVLIVISLAAVLVMKFFPEVAELGTGKKPSIKESIMITELDSGKISSIEISDKNGSFAIDYKKAEVGMNATMRDTDPRLVYDEYQMTTLPRFLCELSATEKVAEGDSEAFGFGTPRREITINLNSGESATLLVGDDLPVGEGVYVKRADGEEIYSVGKTTKERLLIERREFLNYGLFPTIEQGKEIIEIEYAPYGKQPIKLMHRSEEEMKDDTARMGITINYKLTSPINALASPDVLDEVLFDKILAIEGIRVVEDSPSDLAKYGLDRADKLSFKTESGVSVSLLIGATNPAGGSYVMPEGVPMVIETATPVGLSELSASDVTLKLLFFFNSNEINGFDYVLAGGERHSLSLELEEHLIRGSLDGKKLEGRNAANLYQRTIRLSLAGDLDASANYAEPEITVTANLKNGEKKTLSLYKVNERQYAAEVDGKKADFYVPVSEVRDLREAFEIIARGEEIPDMF